jgi:hypothetical protein
MERDKRQREDGRTEGQMEGREEEQRAGTYAALYAVKFVQLVIGSVSTSFAGPVVFATVSTTWVDTG